MARDSSYNFMWEYVEVQTFVRGATIYECKSGVLSITGVVEARTEL
jgi:hypothetical protein